METLSTRAGEESPGQTAHKSFTNSLSEGIQQDRFGWETRLTPWAKGEEGVVPPRHTGAMWGEEEVFKGVFLKIIILLSSIFF